MTGNHSKSPRRNPPLRDATACAARWLLLLPFLFFATFSQGTMLDVASDGGIRIVLCTGEGEVEAVMMPDGTVRSLDGGDTGNHTKDLVCDWVLHAQSALEAGPAAVDPPLLLDLGTSYAIDMPMHLRRADVLTPTARGPPSHT